MKEDMQVDTMHIKITSQEVQINTCDLPLHTRKNTLKDLTIARM